MKPVDIKSNAYIEFGVKYNDKKIKSCWLCKNIKIQKNFCERLHTQLVWRSP